MIELISIHIPKTGGTSFQTILERVYGKNAVLRIDHNLANKKNTENYYSVKPKDITPEIKVIHGHFNYFELLERFDIGKNIPVITWVREPTKRVISAFYYLKQVLNNKLKEANVDERTYRYTKEISVSLLEFAKKPGRRNKMSKFLEGLDLKDLFFIGIVENYTEDLSMLSKMLNWEEQPAFRDNITTAKKKVGIKKKQVIRKLNKKDYKLYRKGIRIRNLRIKNRAKKI